MVERSRIKLLTGSLASILLPALSGCIEPLYEGPPPYGYPPQYYDYYYYPDADVYFHIYTGWYFYHDHGRWRRVRRLPPHMRLDWRRRHSLNIREKNPWQRHDEHRRKYQPPEPRRGLKPKPAPQRPERRTPSPDIRRGVPPARPKSPSPPGHRRDLERDREEREHNIQRHEEYRKKQWRPHRD